MPEQFQKKQKAGQPLKADGQYESGPNIYSHRRYRNWRKRIKLSQRVLDEIKVHKIYRENKDIPFNEYNAFLKSDNPMCVECLEEGHVKEGRVLDHIQPIERGGEKYNEDNLQWLCDRHHNMKRATEDKG
ncbi:MAG: hypothetical protein CL666_04705 [Balneola sp.]|nr:hypothetical protein [Balneola sp.]|tara:strand:+ start:46938 stop:47327 length:390 start_codon:yes stop_codon:yes gene_type:complete